ncbi:MAG: hypothetical protein ABIZ91_13630 [Gemmatimonadaceae bacterium]
MKRSWMYLATVVVGLAVAAPSAQAQGGGAGQGGMRGGAGRMMEMLMKDITLDAEQKAKFDAVHEKYAKEMPAMTPGERPDEAAMTKRREVQAKEHAEMRAVLTAQQRVTFDKNLATMREGMQRRGRGD